MSRGLSQKVQSNPAEAFEIFYNIDKKAMADLLLYKDQIEDYGQKISSHLQGGGRVFLGGCGATGRLSLLLESLMRKYSQYKDQVISFMAGGDFALVRSIEGMEDHEELGARHLMDVGFKPGDLFIGFTEGGETPYVIGATLKAAELSPEKSFFIYCNPTDVLVNHIERSRRTINSKDVHALSIANEPMALSGSTRLQATTLLSFVGGYFLGLSGYSEFSEALAAWQSDHSLTSYLKMITLTQLEADAYQKGEFFNYIAGDLSLTVLTDTTERSPTFSLSSFENSRLSDHAHSWCYLFVRDAHSSEAAWETILGRKPRPLFWDELLDKAGDVYLGFDLSEDGLNARKKRVSKASHDFKVNDLKGGFEFKCNDFHQEFIFRDPSPLNIHLQAKVLLNAHSTILMGMCHRYESNVMTYVRPSNGKLIDRASRYLQALLAERGQQVGLDECSKHLYATYQTIGDGPPLVIEALKSFPPLSEAKA